MDKCPICRGIIVEDYQCQRCGADLAVLCHLRGQSIKLCEQALNWLQKNELKKANELANKAVFLCSDNFTMNLKGYMAFLCDSMEVYMK